jgi:hypothetical protein
MSVTETAQEELEIHRQQGIPCAVSNVRAELITIPQNEPNFLPAKIASQCRLLVS